MFFVLVTLNPFPDAKRLNDDGEKCQRCWTYDVSTGKSPVYENACVRCCKALEEIKKEER